MNMIIVRNETNSDIEAITGVTMAAFENHPYSHNTEQFIIHALRAARALAVSLVAEIDGRVVGHIAFSPAVISGGVDNWYGVGPLSVLPEFQKKGVGKSLMYRGLSSLTAMGANGCVLVGDPAYYEIFGFRNIPDLILEGVPPENFVALPFHGTPVRGVVTFHEAFFATS